jgi:hypothetical protein
VAQLEHDQLTASGLVPEPRWSHQRHLPQLAKDLSQGQDSTVHFDCRFVTIERCGFLARAYVGKGEKRIPVSSIQAVQWEPPGALVNGYIEFTVLGGNETRSQWVPRRRTPVETRARSSSRRSRYQRSSHRGMRSRRRWQRGLAAPAGEPYAPGALSRYWRETLQAAGIRHIKLQAARHTCATLMHLQGVPAAGIAARIRPRGLIEQFERHPHWSAWSR